MSRHPTMREKPGVALQNLVASLERTLGATDSVSIESPGYLIDKDTGMRREHDVLLTWKLAHRRIAGAIECRDRSRKVGVNEVEGFWSKCTRTGVDVPMMVSSRGFTRTAIVKAAAHGIRCMTLFEAENFDWMGMEFLTEFRKNFAPIDVKVLFEVGAPSGLVSLYDMAGIELTPLHFQKIIDDALDLPPDLTHLVGHATPVEILVNTTNWSCLASDGERYPVERLILTTTLTVARRVVPVTMHTYASKDTSYDVARASIDLGGKTGDLVMLKSADGIRVTLHTSGKEKAD